VAAAGQKKPVQVAKALPALAAEAALPRGLVQAEAPMRGILRLKNSAAILRLKNRLSPSDIPEADKIPVLIPQKAFEAIKADGAYEFVEAIEVPTEGNGGIYTAEYFKSVLDYLKQYPVPGDKLGHRDNPSDDFYTIGGELRMENENEGVCYFRVYIPPQGWESSNEGLIRSAKAGIPELSIIAEAEPRRGNDGKDYFDKELGRPRNDLVPQGAMDVTIGNSAGEKEIMELISAGKVDFDTESEELVQNGMVYRRAAVKLQSNADQKALAGRVLNAISKLRKNSKEKNEVTKEEIIAAVKAAIANSTLSLQELAAAVGLENKLRNATDEQREKLSAAIAEALELPPETPVEELLKAAEEAFKEAADVAESVVEAEANEAAGGKKIKNAKGEEEDNPLFLYIHEKLKGKNRKEREKIRNSLATDPVATRLRSQQADGSTVLKLKNGDKNDLASLDEQIDKILNKGVTNG
jgi:lambda repressor-like predicted transcriptional regulator